MRLYFALIFTSMRPYEELVTLHGCACILMLLLALYWTYCAPTPFLYTLHSSQIMLWGRQRAERLPCFIPLRNILLLVCLSRCGRQPKIILWVKRNAPELGSPVQSTLLFLLHNILPVQRLPGPLPVFFNILLMGTKN